MHPSHLRADNKTFGKSDIYWCSSKEMQCIGGWSLDNSWIILGSVAETSHVFRQSRVFVCEKERAQLP